MSAHLSSDVESFVSMPLKEVTFVVLDWLGEGWT